MGDFLETASFNGESVTSFFGCVPVIFSDFKKSWFPNVFRIIISRRDEKSKIFIIQSNASLVIENRKLFSRQWSVCVKFIMNQTNFWEKRNISVKTITWFLTWLKIRCQFGYVEIYVDHHWNDSIKYSHFINFLNQIFKNLISLWQKLANGKGFKNIIYDLLYIIYIKYMTCNII